MKENQSNRLPKARTSQLLTQDVGSEVLIYDLENNQAYALNPTAAFIWLHCDGETTYEALSKLSKEKLKITCSPDLINLALEDFKENNLLTEGSAKDFNLKTVSRRQLLKASGSVAVALPLVLSLVAPTNVAAQSGCLERNVACTDTNQCCPSLVCEGGSCVP